LGEKLDLIVVIGLPNAGKTTYSERFTDVLHYDEISKYSRAEREDIYRSFHGNCIEGIYNSKQSRERLLSCLEDNSRKVCVWIDTTEDECIRRENRGRPSRLVSLHAETFEPPTLDEGWDEIIRLQGGEDNG
jgi:Shikimate kinase